MTIPEKSQDDSEEFADNVASLTLKTENLFKELSERIESLENAFSEYLSQAKCQSVKHAAVLKDLNNMKYQLEKAAKLSSYGYGQPLNLDFLDQMNASNCQVRVNFSGIKEESSGDSTPSASSEDEEVRDSDSGIIGEIKWLKERMGEFSDTLNIQSLITKHLKCQCFKKLQDEFEAFAEDFQKLKCKTVENNEIMNTLRCQDIACLRRQIGAAKKESGNLSCRIKEIEKKMEAAGHEVCERIRAMKIELEGRMHDRLCSRPATE